MKSETCKFYWISFYTNLVIEHICEQLSLDIEKKIHVYKHVSAMQVVANQHLIEKALRGYAKLFV